MKKSLLLIVFILILIVLMSGCLPKTPKEITGPTWTSKYTVPLIKKTKENNNTQIFWGTPPNEDPTKEQEGLGLEDVDTDLSYLLKSDEPFQVDLLTAPLTVNLGEGTIADITVEGIPPEILTDGGVYNVDSEEVSFSLTDLADYVSVKLSDNQSECNYIQITMVGASAGADGFTLSLKDNVTGVVLPSEKIADGNNSGWLYVNGMEFTPDTNLSIQASGKLNVASGATKVGFTFTPAPLEIQSFTITQDSFNTNINQDFTGESTETIFDLPEDIDEIDLLLKAAKLSMYPVLLDNMQINANLTIQGCDEMGVGLGDPLSRSITLSNGGTAVCDLLEGGVNLNTIFAQKPRQIKMLLSGFSTEATGDLTVEYPAPISLDYDFNLGIKSLTYTPSEGSESGEAKIPDDMPVDFKNAKIFFEINNTSPAGLTLEIRLSPNPNIDPAAPSTVINILEIKPSSKETSIIILSEQDYSDLTDSGMVYHQIIIENTSEATEGPGPFTEDHYLEVTVWAQVECLVNKR